MHAFVEFGTVAAVLVLSLAILGMVVGKRNEAFEEQRRRNRVSSADRLAGKQGTNRIQLDKQEIPQDSRARGRSGPRGNNKAVRSVAEKDSFTPSDCELMDGTTTMVCNFRDKEQPVDLNEHLDVAVGADIKRFYPGSGLGDRCVDCTYSPDTGDLNCTCAVSRVKNKDLCKRIGTRIPARGGVRPAQDCHSVSKNITEDLENILVKEPQSVQAKRTSRNRR